MTVYLFINKQFKTLFIKLNMVSNFRDVGGIRASTYNAVTIEEVEALVSYMKDFYKKHGK